MILDLTDYSGEPLQAQIVRQIKAMILSGELPAGLQLPSIRSFAREQRVSVITVQKAYESLQAQGLVVPHPGKGFYVCNIDTDTKKLLSRKSLTERAGPIIGAAMNEGLSPEEILITLNTIIKDIEGKSK